MSDSVWPHRWQPTRLPHPWDSPGKNTGVGCHFLLQCRKVKRESEVAQCVRLLGTPWTAAHQASPSMGFSRREYWSGVASPSLDTSLSPLLICRVTHHTVFWLLTFCSTKLVSLRKAVVRCTQCLHVAFRSCVCNEELMCFSVFHFT